MGDNALMSDVLELVDVSVVRDGRALVDHVSWSVAEGERWVILGPNGAGKTTLLNVASSYLFPTTGTVQILGDKLGNVDVFDCARGSAWPAPPWRRSCRAGRPYWRRCSPPRTA